MIINCLNIAELSYDNYELFISEVSGERRRKAERFHFKKDAYRCVCAEMLLQYSFFEKNNEYVKNNLVYNKYGKPTIKDENKFCFNLSHSGDWVVLAYGMTEVGVDIEKIQLGREGMIDSIFRQEEKEYIYSVTGLERDQRLIQMWTLKESYIKYLGTGFSTDMNTFYVDALKNVVKNNNGELEKQLYIKSIIYGQDYYLSICSKEVMLVIKEVSLEDLIEMICRKRKVRA